MGYYSVYINGEPDQISAGQEARDLLGGRVADFTGGYNFFYVQKNYAMSQLKSTVQDIVGAGYKVSVKRITKQTYLGR